MKITGTIQDKLGNTVQGSEVTAFNQDNSTFVGKTTSDATGSFQFNLTEDESMHWDSGFVKEPYLFLYYKFFIDFYNQNVLLDDLYNSNDATKTTGIDWNTNGIIETCLESQPGQNGQYVVANLNPTYNLHNSTISCWVQPRSNSRISYITAANNRVRMEWNGSANSFSVRGDDGFLLQYTGPQPGTYLQWNHIVYTDDGAIRSLYVNGVLRDTTVSGANNTINQLYLLNQNTSSATFDGYLDEYGIYNTALTASEVSTLYNQQLNQNLQPDDGPYISYNFHLTADSRDSNGIYASETFPNIKAVSS